MTILCVSAFADIWLIMSDDHANKAILLRFYLINGFKG